jgi:hypothetical protein
VEKKHAGDHYRDGLGALEVAVPSNTPLQPTSGAEQPRLLNET